MRRIRGGSGLGDAIYVRVIADHLIACGYEVEACTNYPEVFLGSRAKTSPFRRNRVDVLCHYSARKYRLDTTQWEDVCGTAGLGALPLRIEWAVRNIGLVERILQEAGGRKIVVVHGGRVPMGRTDGFGKELLPCRSAFDATLAELNDCFLVQVGKGEQLYRIRSDLNLCGETSVSDLFDIASISSGMVAQCSYAVPLAECLDKPLLAIWSAAGMKSSQQYVKAITPKKILSKASSSFVVDDWQEDQIEQAAHAFRRSLSVA